jgi:hypothetical protein
MTGSFRNDEDGRPASIAHVEVERERQGTGRLLVLEAMRLFRQCGLDEFVTTGQTTSGERLFGSLERDGYIKLVGGWKNGSQIEPVYKIVRLP